MIVKKNTRIKKILSEYPESNQLFGLYGVSCAGCSLAESETIEEGLNEHGIDVDIFIDELNTMINQMEKDRE